MNKILFLRALIAGCATIMQFWTTFLIFNNDYQCRTKFVSCADVECKTIHYTDYWMRVFNDLAVATASFVFIPLVLIEAWRSSWMIGKICCGGDDSSVSSFEYCSPFGFLAMVLNPGCFNTKISSTRAESFMIIIDCLAITLVFQYSVITDTSIMVPFMLAILVSSSCNGLGYLLNIFSINYRLQNAGVNNHNFMQDQFLDRSVQERALPPPYNNNPGKIILS